jgi:hypothetical protein
MLQTGDIVQFVDVYASITDAGDFTKKYLDIYGVVVSKAVISKDAGNWCIHWFDSNISECHEDFLEKVVDNASSG